MIKNYLLTAIRNITKHKSFSGINIFGLSVGLAACLLIFGYVKNELSYDDFHLNGNRIYMLGQTIKMGESEITMSSVSSGIATAMIEVIPEIEEAVRIRKENDVLLKVGNVNFNEETIFYTDSNLFDVFTFSALYGDLKESLNKPMHAVITRDIAQKYYGKDNAVGETFIYKNKYLITVSAIIENALPNSQLNFPIIFSYATIESTNQILNPGMNFSSDITFVMTDKPENITKINETMPQIIEKVHGERFAKMIGIEFVPLTELYFSKSYGGAFSPQGNKETLYLFSSIALIILLIASINYMNLSTAQYTHRLKEVGIRKVVGGSNRKLFNQFLGESIIITFMAMMVGLVIFELLKPLLNSFIGKKLAISYFNDPILFVFIIVLVLFVGIVSGSYPAVFLSRFKPIQILKDKRTKSSGSIILRKALVVVQFIVAITLTTGTIIIYKQLNFFKSKDTGFRKENIVFMDLFDVKFNIESFRNELEKVPGIEMVSQALYFPSSGAMAMQGIKMPDATDDESILMQRLGVDCNYIDILQLEVIQGRKFDENLRSDSNKVILNEAAVKALNFENPVGMDFPAADPPLEIIGVVKDFHLRSLKTEIDPAFMTLKNTIPSSTMAILINSEQSENVIKSLESLWEKFSPNKILQYEFLEDSFNEQYESEQKTGQLFLFFSILIVLIACLGIYGLASFTIEKRHKEIGIRKVHGAKTSQISLLLVREYLYWVILANLMAIPAAYYGASKWLQDFAYKTELSVSIFALSAFLTFVIALATVSIKSVQAANQNPVDTLRYE